MLSNICQNSKGTSVKKKKSHLSQVTSGTNDSCQKWQLSILTFVKNGSSQVTIFRNDKTQTRDVTNDFLLKLIAVNCDICKMYQLTHPAFTIHMSQLIKSITSHKWQFSIVTSVTDKLPKVSIDKKDIGDMSQLTKKCQQL